MNSKAHRADTVLRVVCAAAMSVAAALFLFIFVGLCIQAVRRHEFSAHELGLPIALGMIGLLTFFSAHIAWRLWRGSLSPNGRTFMPTWFIRMFGVFFLVGVAFAAYHYPSLMLAEGVFIALAMVFFRRHLAKRRKEFDRDG